MSNVRQHKGGNMACYQLSGRIPLSLPWQRLLSFLAAHLNRQPEPLAAACHESQLEAAALLLPSSNPRLPGVCWFPAAVRSTAGYKALAGAVSSGGAEVREKALLAGARLAQRVSRSMHLCAGVLGAPFAKHEGHAEYKQFHSGLRVSPNPSIERTFQRPLRALWPAAHVER